VSRRGENPSREAQKTVVELALHVLKPSKMSQRNLRKRAQSAISALDVLRNSVEFFYVNDASHSAMD
jgi:hypothetical protein